MLKYILSFFILITPSCNKPLEHQWKGILLGTEAKIVILHPNPIEAQKILTRCSKYLRGIEKQISLYQKNSHINQLNNQKKLNSPPLEFYQILKLAKQFSKKTNGNFDISISPLWQAIKNNQPIKAVQSYVDYKRININTEKISIGEKQQISLNALGQGFLADKAYKFLKDNGISNALINTGEYRCLGNKKWSVSTYYKRQWHHFELTNGQALATSSSKNNIIPSSTKLNTTEYLAIVIAPTATEADAYATIYAANKELDQQGNQLIILE